MPKFHEPDILQIQVLKRAGLHTLFPFVTFDQHTMLSLDRILTPIANALFAFLRQMDASLGRPTIREISAEDLRKRQTEIVIVDVRSEAEYSVSMIPDAITKAQFEAKLIAGSQPTVVPYCTVGGRSYLYARKLAKQGILTQNFKSGIVGWCNAKMPLVQQDGKPTNRVYISDPARTVPPEYEVVR